MNSDLRNFIFSMQNNENKTPFHPLILAVSGHRKIEENAWNAVGNSTAFFLKNIALDWKKCCQNDSDPPEETAVFLLCGMATGSDTLAAEKIIHMKAEHPELNCKLVAVLPMPKDHYEKDFSKESDRKKFFELLSQADCVMELPLTPDNQTWTDQYTHETLPENLRISQYSKLAEFLVFNSSCLLVLWDGIGLKLNNDNSKLNHSGGTSEVVCLKLASLKMAKISPEKNETFPHFLQRTVFQIVTPRRKGEKNQIASGIIPGQIIEYYYKNGIIKNDYFLRNRQHQSVLSDEHVAPKTH